MFYIISGKSQPPLFDHTNFNRATTSATSSVLPGLTVSGNYAVNMYFGQISSQVAEQVPPKRRHGAILENSDEYM